MTNKIPYAILAACLVFSSWFFVAGLGNLTLDSFAFRQAQTAISAFWIARGGPLLGYETPVLGAPWAIPFEFPLYQYLVALLSKTGLSINAAGRSISFFVFILTIWPMAVLLRKIGYSNTAVCTFSALLITSPLYVFWSRSIMIETLAVFLSVSWLALLTCYLQNRSKTVLIACVISGTLAMLTKVTTFPPFALIGAVIYCSSIFKVWKQESRFSLFDMMATALTVLIPLVISVWWLSYSDGVKLLNLEGAHLTSSALNKWNFGTLDQKFGSELWYFKLKDRILPELLGYSSLLSVAVIGAGLALKARALHIVLCLVAFVSAFLIFTNLHIVHNYYQVANGIFLIAALAIALESVRVRFKFIVYFPIVICILAGQVTYVMAVFYPIVQVDAVQNGVYPASIAAKNVTRPDESILVFGTDWSSEVPYYTERKGFAVPGWASEDLIANILTDPQSFLGDVPMGAIVDCFSSDDTRTSTALIRNALETKVVIFEGSGCRVLLP